MKIIHLEKIKEEPAKSNPKVKIKVLLKKGNIPNVEMIGQVYLKPGNIASEHTHEDAYEAFLVQEGAGIIKIDGKVHQVGKGDFLLVEPGEAHEILNTNSEDLVITFFEVKKSKK